MSRNNKERTGAVPQAEAPLPETTNTQTPLHFVAPTEFVELPSKGLGYSAEHPLHGKDTIEIRYMTAKDEDILTSKTLLKKGIAIERFLDNIIVDKNIKGSTMLVGDRNAVIIASRISGYGSDYETKISCPSCAEVSTFTFDLNKKHTHESEVDESLGLTQTPDGYFNVIMPLSKFNVKFKLLNGKDEIYLTQLATNKEKGGITGSGLTDQYKRMIVSVEDHTDKKVVNNYINNMPTRDSRFLRTCYRVANPDVKIIDNFSCTACGFEQELEVPFGADFFWPQR